ncbi:AAA family ATPase [Pseudonocardia sp. N23]|uniref:ATP-binding protein n=1 Tax=Pseudonocardia sp. N23 TaxID=1987376 RepID=UPI000BFB543F|nr:AAA family ATPase [Pseudonocardia sp. N23]GAY09472.1 putative LuxR-family transcriptional regulator [Pseudonocardia sp. N23]
MLHGRESELRELLAAAAAAFAARRGTSALIVGDAGIGKTRLAAEVADRLRADDVHVAWAACRSDRGAPPYWPVRQLLAALDRSDALAVPAGAEPEFAPFLVLDAVAAAFGAAAPVLLVVDDVQWADAATLRLLGAMRAHLASTAVLLLATCRDTDPDAAQALDTLLADRRIALRGLAAPMLVPVVAELTGEDVDPAAAAELHARTGGNPFFAAEVVRMRRAGDATGVPGGVRAVLDRRLDRLPAGTETVLRAAAVLDAGVTAGVDGVLLARVAGVAPADLAAAVGPATDAGLLTHETGRVRFPHALVAETLAARTPAAQRLPMHRRALDALTARAASGAADDAAVAHQALVVAELSGDPGDGLRAARAAASAAAQAAADTAHEDALRWLDAALAALPGDDPAHRDVRADLLCARGEAALAADDIPTSRAAFTAAAARGRAAGRADVLATAALGATGGSAGFEVDLADPDRVALLEEALAALPTDDSALRCAVTARLSVALSHTAGEDRRAGLADAAVAMARRLGDPRARASALAAWCDAVAGPDHVAARRAAATEIVESARGARDRAAELLGRRLRLVAMAEAGDWVAVDAEIDGYARVAAAVRRPGLSWLVPLWRGTRATMRGDTAAEAVHTAERDRLATLSGSPNAELLAMTQDFVRAALRGRASASVGRFQELAPESVAASHCTVALLHALSGASVQARLSLQRYLAARSDGPRDSEWLPEVVQCARTALIVGDRDAARDVYALLVPFAGQFAIEGILAGTWGSVDGHLGRLAASVGDDTAARRHLADAAVLDTAAGAALTEHTWEAPAAADAAFVRDGEVWTLRWAGREVRLRDTKGLRDLATLLARPGRDVASAELVGSLDLPVPAAAELADRTAVAAYRRRLLDLQDDLDDATAAHDPVRAERAVAERDALLAELGAVTGLGGRPRTAASDAERMRKAVGNRVRQALARIDDVHPELGRHLAVSVRTGTFCRYAPDREVHWQL